MSTPMRFHLALFQRFSVDTAVFTPFSWRRMQFREHSHIDAFSPKTLSVLIVWTEVLKSSKCIQFEYVIGLHCDRVLFGCRGMFFI